MTRALTSLSIGFDGAGNLAGQTSNNGSFTYSSTNQLLTGSSNGQQLLTASYDTADQAQRRTVTEKIGTTADFGSGRVEERNRQTIGCAGVDKRQGTGTSCPR